MNKIMIIGSPGAGKTTLATQLGSKLALPVYHLDKYFWQENWKPLQQEEFKIIQNKLVSEKRWIIDGNFTQSMDIRMSQAEVIIFLDFPKLIILWRYFYRYFKNYNKIRTDVGGNNKQNIKWKHLKFVLFYPIDEVYALIKQYAKNKRVIVLRNPPEVNKFLDQLAISSFPKEEGLLNAS